MTSKYLTEEQRGDFHKRHRRLLFGIAIALASFLGVGIVDEFVPLERYGLAITLGGFVVVIFVVICMFGYRCPACKKVPRARMWSFGGGEAAYSSRVALFPKTCSECGVWLCAEKKS